MAKHNTLLYLYMNGHFVGTLQQGRNNELTLNYDADWLKSGHARPVSISLPMDTEKYHGEKVQNFFDNLLPDNRDVRRLLKARVNAQSDKTFDLLYELGRDCVGAIQLLPDKPLKIQNAISSKQLSESEIAERLRGLKSHPLGIGREKEFRISLAGMQDKMALLRKGNEWHLPLNATPTTHIFKLELPPHPDADFGNTVENEWLCGEILRGFNLPTARSEICTFEDVKTLVVERFDRRWSDDGKWILRIPQEDLCQALGVGPSDKYETEGGPGIIKIMQFLEGSQEALQDKFNFLRTQILFFMLAAIDGHAKNFSILIQAQGRYQLTPLYDVMSAHPFINPRFPAQKLKMAMALEGKSRHYHWDKIHKRHFVSTAEACGITREVMNDILEEILDKAPAVMEKVGHALPAQFPERIWSTIHNGVMKSREVLMLMDN